MSDPLTFAELRAANVARQSDIDAPNRPLVYWGNALAGEVGEACNFIKKLARIDTSNPAYEKQGGEWVLGLIKELGDIQVYLDLLANELGVDLGAVVRAKFNEVSARYQSPVRLEITNEKPSGIVPDAAL